MLYTGVNDTGETSSPVITGVPAVDGVPVVACVLAVVGVHAVAGVPTVSGFHAVAVVPAVDGAVDSGKKKYRKCR